MSPVFQSPALVPPAVLEAERAIIREEGLFHVRGIYLANAADAANARRVEAERRVEQEERQRRLRAACPWCGGKITDADEAVELGGRRLHRACRDEFDERTAERES